MADQPTTEALMADLHLNSLEIKNFRTFKHLEIERLGRVNLIVGKNGVGKTALLEALRLYAHKGDFPIIWDILSSRSENSRVPMQGRSATTESLIKAIRYLFHGRREIGVNSDPILLGEKKSPGSTLSISWGWYEQVKNEEDGTRFRQLSLPLFDFEDYPARAIPALTVRYGNEQESMLRLDIDLRRRLNLNWAAKEFDEPRSVFVAASGLAQEQIELLWDRIALTNLEEDILKSLRIISPTVDRISFIGERTYSRGRLPIVKVSNVSEPIPLLSLGEGMNRMLGIALALVNAKDGFSLNDEIESGLHYSVQPDMWRLIFETAERLNVQVFATTHSLDCLRAFESAASERGKDESMLISLRRHHDDPEKIVAVLADKEKLETIVHSSIEVR